MLASDLFNTSDPSSMAQNIMHTAYANAMQTEAQRINAIKSSLTTQAIAATQAARPGTAMQTATNRYQSADGKWYPYQVEKATHTGAPSVWSDLVGQAENALSYLAKPLKEIQRDYKYIHSLYTRHGVLYGVLGGLAVVGGGVLGTFVGGPAGTVIGADLAAEFIRKMGGATEDLQGRSFQDSVNDSENENYKVSFGRDVANALGANGKTDKGQGWGSTLSGFMDSTFDVVADPLIVAGKVRSVIRSGKYVLGADGAINVVADGTEAGLAKASQRVPIIYRSQAVQNYLASNSLHMTGSPDALMKLKYAIDNPSPLSVISGSTGRVRRGLNEIASIPSASEITVRFPSLGPIAPELAKADSADKVFNVFLRTLKEDELRNRFAQGGLPIIPSRTLIGKVTSPALNRLRQPGWGSLEADAFSKNNAANFIIPRIKQDNVGFNQFVAENTSRIIGESEAKAAAAKAAGKGEIPVISSDLARKQAIDLAHAENWNQWVPSVIMNPFNKGAWATATAKKVRTFTGIQPATISKDLSEISTRSFKPSNPASFRDIYRVAYFGMGHKMAQTMTDAYIESGTFDKAGNFIPGYDTHNLWLSIQSEALNALGFPNAPSAISDTLETIAAKSKGTIGGNIFGHGYTSGINASSLSTEAGTQKLALWADQAATWAYPDFRVFTKAARDMTLHGRIYGTVEGVAHKYLSQVWSRLALTTGGFAIRVATGELIPTLIRFGGIKTIEGSIAKTAAKMGVKLMPEESKSLLAHAMLATSADGVVDYTNPASVTKFIKDAIENSNGKTARKNLYNMANRTISKKSLDRANLLAIATGGHMATGATLAGHLLDHDINVRIAQELDMAEQTFRPELEQVMPSERIINPSGKHKAYTAYDHHHDIFWNTMLQKASNDPVRRAIVKDVLDALKSGKTQDEAWKEATDREYARISGHEYDPTSFDNLGKKLTPAQDLYKHDKSVGLHRYHMQDHHQFAFSRTDDMRNTLTGADGTFHDEIAHQIVNNEKISLEDTMNVGINSKPYTVLGPELIDHVGNVFDRATNFIFRNGLDPIINKVSREPLFFQHFNKAMDFYEHQVTAGLIDTPTAVRLSMQRATHAMIPQIHNVALKSQFSILAKSFLPFYFAEEQAIGRFARLVKEKGPQAIRYYQMIHQGLNDPGFVNQDTNGNRYLTLPGVGELGGALLAAENNIPGFQTVRGVPINAEGNLDSLASVLPEFKMPGWSPFVSVPLNYFAAHFPGLSNPVKRLVGDKAFQQSWVDSIMPSAPLKNIFKAMTANETDSVVANSMMASIMAANYHNQFPDGNASPQQQQEFIDHIKNNALSMIFLKGLVGMVSPLAPKISQEDIGLRQEFQDLLKTQTYPEAWATFSSKYGEKSRGYTISQSDPKIPGTNIPYTKAAYDWLAQNESLLANRDYAVGAAFLVPQLKGPLADKQVMATELFKLGLKNKKTPSQFAESIYVAHGNDMYYAAKDAVQVELDNMIKHGASPEEYNVQVAHWKDWENNFIKTNPIWYSHFSADAVGKGSMAKVAYLQLKDMFANHDEPKGPQTEIVRDLLVSYQKVQDAKAAGGPKHDINMAWKTYLDQYMIETPESKSVINSVFGRL